MRIIVIGGTGQLGHFIMKYLTQKGHQTMAIGLGNPPETGFLPDETQILSQDVNSCTVEELTQIIYGADVVVHAAGADGRNLFDAPAIDGFRAANVTPIVTLIDAMKRAGSKRLIILGSYYTAMHRRFPTLNLLHKSAYIRSRQEQADEAFIAAGKDFDVGILELPYIFGAAPNRGTLWGFYIKTLQETIDDVPVHAGGTACITMNQVGIATANACESATGHQYYPIGNENLSYVQIFEHFATALNIQRNIVARPAEYFLESARKQTKALKNAGKESAYDPIGMLEMEENNFFIDPEPAMETLDYPHEDIAKAIRESVQATLQFEGKGPGTTSLSA